MREWVRKLQGVCSQGKLLHNIRIAALRMGSRCKHRIGWGVLTGAAQGLGPAGANAHEDIMCFCLCCVHVGLHTQEEQVAGQDPRVGAGTRW